jgi:hypothetical protein
VPPANEGYKRSVKRRLPVNLNMRWSFLCPLFDR